MNSITTRDEFLSIENHEKCRYESISFEGGDLEELVFEGCEFYSCMLDKVCFTHTVFNSCSFLNSTLILCAIAGTTFNNVRFRECKVAGLNFTESNTFAFSPSFYHAVLDGCMFFSNNLSNMEFTDSQLRNTDFIECNLKETDFSCSQFESVEFSRCNMEKAVFINALGYSINPFENRIKHAKFDLPEAQSFLGFLGIDFD